MKRVLLTLAAFAMMTAIAGAQTNDFTYQGTLNLNGAPASGTFDFEFRLFDAENGGAQVGPTATRSGVAVSNGAFTVSLAFAGGFPGADRWLEIWVRPAGGGGFQQLLPRVKISSVPYAVKSLSAENATISTTANNALSLGGVAAAQFVQTADPRLTDARTPTAGSGNYIQNTTTQQTTSNFHISGDGTVGGTLRGNIVSATNSFYIGPDRVIGTPGNRNTFVGRGTGTVSTGADNSFLGHGAGSLNTSGVKNTFAGSGAGDSNTTGLANSFFGADAGAANSIGQSNVFVGVNAGLSSSEGNRNAFLGTSAGEDNTVGTQNTFVGTAAGISNVSGSNNSSLGSYTSFGSGNLVFATAIGAAATASQSNSIYLGRAGGEDTVRIPGNLNLTGAASLNGNLIVASGGLSVFNGNVVIPTLGSAGSTSLCRNASNIISTCSSSLKYKTDFATFSSGLELVNRLIPITFNWKDGGMADLGLGAEDVAAIEPLLVTHNAKGEVEGVKYDRIGVVLVNAVKEQQRQIDAQRAEIQALRDALCELNPQLGVCNSQEKK